MPLQNGASYKAFSANIAELIRAGHSRDSAVFIAAAHFRKNWFVRHPKGALPLWAAYPKTARLRHDYTPDGKPLVTQRNPVDRPREAALQQATRLYTGFTGKAPKTLRRVDVPPLPETALAIGKIFGILYTVDATGERFHHEFKGKARPTLIVGSDGKQVFMCGGAYTFTKRGFVDNK